MTSANQQKVLSVGGNIKMHNPVVRNVHQDMGVMKN